MAGKGNFTPTLTRLAKKAKLLKEWTRTGIFEGESAAYHDLERGMRYEGKQQMNKRLEQIARDQRNLNNFFKEFGFPALPKHHVLSRCWDEKLKKTRRAMEGPKPKKKRKRKAFDKNMSEKSKHEDCDVQRAADKSREASSTDLRSGGK